MRLAHRIGGFVIATLLLSIGGSLAQTQEFDLLIRNGRVFDGSLKPAFAADVAIKDGRIVRVATSIRDSAAKTIDAKGFYVSPGFIDLHTHADRGMNLPENRASLNYLYQGVTTMVAGQCGSSAWNIFEQAEDQIKRWSEEGIGPNAALLVGHGTVRQLAMGRENRAPTAEELQKMKALVKEAMEQGASGLSTGLIYVPGSYSKTEEVIELVKVIAPYDGIYHTHIRNEGDRLLEAVREAIDIGDKAGARVHISHFKVIGKEHWGMVKESCRLVEEARARGLKVTADQYPYRFSNNSPYTRLIPAGTWRGAGDVPRIGASDIERLFQNLLNPELIALYSKVTPYYPLSARHQQYLEQLTRERLVSLVADSIVRTGDLQGIANPRERTLFVRRLQNPVEAEKIRKEVRENIEQTGAENLIIGVCPDRRLEGKSLKEAAAIRGKSLDDTAIELDLMDAKIVPYRMSEDDIEYIMKRDYVTSGSDGEAPSYGMGLPHIRSYSTFLYKLKEYALKRKAVSVEHVIRSQTSLPAEIMKWSDRGWIKEGYRADIAVLDLENIEIEASITTPHRYCKGVKHLLVNGVPVIENENWTGKLPGKVITLGGK